MNTNFHLITARFGPRPLGCHGLTYAWAGGSLIDHVTGVVFTVDPGEAVLPDQDVSYVQRDALGAVTVNQTGFSTGSWPLAVVTTVNQQILDVLDCSSLARRVGELLSGSGAPDDTATGKDGDFYFSTAGPALYGPKAAGTWPAGTMLAAAAP